MSVEASAAFIQALTYSAEITRRSTMFMLTRGATVGSVTGGLVGYGDCALSQPGSGMSVNVGAGEVIVPGSSSSSQSGYYCRVSSTTNLAIAASDPANPRIDTVVAQVQDAAYTGVTNSFSLTIVTGVATGGANLTNLTGAGSVPASSLVIGYVLVPALATNIIGADLLTSAKVAAFGLGDSGWLNLTAATNYTVGATGAYTASARLIADTVHLSGVVVDTVGGHTFWNQIATIPAGLRPSASVGGATTAVAWAAGAAVGSITIGGWFVTPAGALYYNGTTGNQYAVMLDGLNYRLS